MARGDQLGHDRQPDLGRLPTAQVEPDRSMEAGEVRVVQAGRSKADATIRLGTLAADSPHVTDVCGQRRYQGRLIDLWVVGQDDHRVVGPQSARGERAIRPVGDDFQALEPWLISE
jgi:hypothetical protein